MENCAILLFLFFYFFVESEARFLKTDSSDHSVSDGVNFLRFDRFAIPKSNEALSKTCLHMYGFFPCADNIGGYIFQIIVYQYLLIISEKLVTTGSKTIFNILGTGFFGASLFRILMVLPTILMVIVSGISTTKENAQNQVSIGVGMCVGSSTFCLTVLWGMCVVVGRNEIRAKFVQNSNSTLKCFRFGEKLSFLCHSGIEIDKKTSYTAGFMLLSLIPFVIVQLVNMFESPFSNRLVVLIALIVSGMSLISYFVYQTLDPWIQERSLEYSKYENLLAGFLDHVQRHAKGKLINDEGEPNIDVIKRLFAQSDKDADKSITVGELEALVEEIQSGKANFDKEYGMEKVLTEFDVNKDGRIEEHEFINGCKKWIIEAKKLAENGDSASRGSLRQAVEQLIKDRKHQLTKIEYLMSRIMKHVHNQPSESERILTEDGNPNHDYLKSLFSRHDSDQTKAISKEELKDFILSVNFGHFEVDRDLAVEKIMEEFDRDNNAEISEEEFISGFAKWIDKATQGANCPDPKNSIDEFDKIIWKEVDSLVYEVGERGRWGKSKYMRWVFVKSVLKVVLGIGILTFLAGPLVSSIRQLSDAMNLPSFFISFVVLPVALNTRLAVRAVFPASQKTKKTASLTFSEIYGGVVMNNITSMATLLAIVLAKGLAWDYSAEVLIVLAVGSLVGLLAFLRSTYPLWTSIFAFLLYPFSLFLFYVLQFLWG